MKLSGLPISAALLFSLIALLSLLLAPLAAVGQITAADTPTAMASGQDHGGCHGDCDDLQDGNQQDGCCGKSACACPCHAPLTFQMTAVARPLVVATRFVIVSVQQPPQVYLPIFVPPQNRS